MQVHRSSNENSEDDEEDFLPTIPVLLVNTSEADSAEPTRAGEESVRGKRPRSLGPSDRNDEPIDTSDDVQEGVSKCKKQQSTMDMLSAEGYPCSFLYERSYRHGSPVQDIATLADDNGALIVTVDAVGVVRAWRKLPRGVFFTGEYRKFFHKSVESEEVTNAGLHFVLPDPVNSCILFVCVTPHAADDTGNISVNVEVSRVNGPLMALEGRFSLQFNAARRCHPSATQPWKESFTPRPFLFHHDYQPYIAFFAKRDDDTNGVVFIPCGVEKSSRLCSSDFTKEGQPIPTVALSCANLIVCCQQHLPSGLIVLVDEEGIVDYARIVEHLNDEGRTILSLRVVGGFPSRSAADPLKVRQWITFERRQKTGFFALVREVTCAAKTGKVIIPLSVDFSPTGNYFTVSSASLRRGAVCVLLHLFEFASGVCLCSSETSEVPCPQLGELCTLQEAKSTLRGFVFNAVIKDSFNSSPRGVWIFVPEITGVPEPSRECVGGRRIATFRAAPSAKEAGALKSSFYIEKLPCSIGESEVDVRGDSMLMEIINSFSRMACGEFRCFAAPLKLLRLCVPASQALKNLVAQSPVGCALSKEDIKRLFEAASSATPSAGFTEEHNSHVDDPTICTTSLGGNALLLYTKYEISLTDFVMQSAVGIPNTDKNTEDDTGNERQRALLLSTLRAKRDFDCDDLLQLQSSLQVLAPRDEEERTTSEVEHSKASENSCGFDGEVEERRVQSIISAASTRVVSWTDICVGATISVRTFGTITVRLMPQFAPKAVTNFSTLSRRGFYNTLTFHRVVPGFMIQGGCPHGDGTGGLSSFGEPFEDEGVDAMDFFSYPRVQWLCMANRGPNTNESQFFITLGEATPWLNGKHTVFGFVTAGKSVVLSVSQVERNGDDKPVMPVVIDQVAVSEEGLSLE